MLLLFFLSPSYQVQRTVPLMEGGRQTGPYEPPGLSCGFGPRWVATWATLCCCWSTACSACCRYCGRRCCSLRRAGTSGSAGWASACHLETKWRHRNQRPSATLQDTGTFMILWIQVSFAPDQTRWTVSRFHWIYCTYPPGKEPIGNVWKGKIPKNRTKQNKTWKLTGQTRCLEACHLPAVRHDAPLYSTELLLKIF